MPVINPADLWQRSGRYSIDEVFKLKDRKGAEMVLALTAEEVITFHVSSIVRSYRQLPFSAYHFQTKGRDEARPRAGILRTREFIMKDAYTFDRDRAGLDEHYEHFRGAYDRIFDRCRARVVPGRVGRRDDGRLRRPRVHGAVPGGRERRRAGARLRGQRRGRERRARAGRAARAARRARGGADARPDHDRRGRRLAAPAGGRAAEVLSRDGGGPRARARRAARRPPGQRRSSSPTRSARRSAPRARTSSPSASAPPARWARSAPTCRCCSTTPSRPGPYVAGANRDGYHLQGVEPGRDFPFKRADVRTRRGRRHRRTATRSGSSRRSRSATSSSSARASPSRWAPPTSTSTATSS